MRFGPYATNVQVQEIPPNATLTIDLEMLTVVNKDYLR